jgi:hypothetical protein
MEEGSLHLREVRPLPPIPPLGLDARLVPVSGAISEEIAPLLFCRSQIENHRELDPRGRSK